MEVFQKGQEVSVAVAKDGFVPTLEEMSHGLIPSVIVHGITLVDALEDFGKRGVVCFDEEMNMVGHEYVRVEVEVVALLVCGKDFEKFPIIEGIFKYLLFLVPSRDHVIKSAFVFNPGFSGHGKR
jgi:predicted cation transporter